MRYAQGHEDPGPILSERDELLLEDVLGRMEVGRVIPVVGPELLTLPAPGSHTTSVYEQLADGVAQRLELAGAAPTSGGDPLEEALFRFMRSDSNASRQMFDRVLKAVAKRKTRIPSAVRRLAKIRDFHTYVTTTVDDCLQRALGAERKRAVSVQCYSRGSEPVLDEHLDEIEHVTLFYLFGKIDTMSRYVVSDEDRLEFLYQLAKQGKAEAGILRELRRSDLLLIGTRLHGWLGRFFLRILKGKQLSKTDESLRLLADRSVREDAATVTFLKRYSHETHVFEGNEGSGLEFIDELYRRYSARNRRRKPMTTVSRRAAWPGFVFVSYSHQDSEAAHEVAETLRGAGFEVWIDRHLGPGDKFNPKIRERIEKCAAFLPILSPNTQEREAYYYREWRRASERENGLKPGAAFIFPVALQSMTPETLPHAPEVFGETLWCSWVKPADRTLLLDRLRSVLRPDRPEDHAEAS